MKAYSTTFMSLRKGFPLFSSVADEVSSSIKVGNVGTLQDAGRFKLVFDIGAPPEDSLPSLDVQTEVEHLNETQFMTGDVKLEVIPPDSEIDGTRRHHLIRFHAEQPGAIVYLPHGSSRTEHTNHESLRKYTTANASKIMKRIRKDTKDNKESENNVFLITGFDSVAAWVVAAWNSGPAKIDVIADEKDDKTVEYGAVVIPTRDDIAYNVYNSVDQPKDKTIFIRGFVISARSRSILENTGRFVTAVIPILRSLSTEPSTSETNDSKGEMWHPLVEINDWILSKSLIARYAVTHDNVWMNFGEEILDSDGIINREKLIEAVQDNYDVDVAKAFMGVGMLKAKKFAKAPSVARAATKERAKKGAKKGSNDQKEAKEGSNDQEDNRPQNNDKKDDQPKI